MKITDERIAELAEGWEHQSRVYASAEGGIDGDSEYGVTCTDTAEALRAYQSLLRQPREIICTQCGLREQLGQLPPAEF